MKMIYVNHMEEKQYFCDFRQILPVIPHGSRGTLIQNCITSWHAFSYFHKITFTRNMRALSNEIQFVEFLKKLVMMKPHNMTRYMIVLMGEANIILKEVIIW